jgi:hypothetical protein
MRTDRANRWARKKEKQKQIRSPFFGENGAQFIFANVQNQNVGRKKSKNKIEKELFIRGQSSFLCSVSDVPRIANAARRKANALGTECKKI